MSETKKKTFAVLTSGGDAPGMNAAVRSVVRTALHKGHSVYGIFHGYEGLMEDRMDELQERSVSNIINRGGTILYTARSKEFMTEEGQKKAAAILRSRGIDGLVVMAPSAAPRSSRPWAFPPSASPAPSITTSPPPSIPSALIPP